MKVNGDILILRNLVTKMTKTLKLRDYLSIDTIQVLLVHRKWYEGQWRTIPVGIHREGQRNCPGQDQKGNSSSIGVADEPTREP